MKMKMKYGWYAEYSCTHAVSTFASFMRSKLQIDQKLLGFHLVTSQIIQFIHLAYEIISL